MTCPFVVRRRYLSEWPDRRVGEFIAGGDAINLTATAKLDVQSQAGISGPEISPNQIVERVVAGHPKKGLIWHFQGSGKSLLMLFAARKLRLHPALKNPTVMIVVDRIDLDSQISSTFYAADTPNLVKADSRASCSAC